MGQLVERTSEEAAQTSLTQIHPEHCQIDVYTIKRQMLVYTIKGQLEFQSPNSLFTQFSRQNHLLHS